MIVVKKNEYELNEIEKTELHKLLKTSFTAILTYLSIALSNSNKYLPFTTRFPQEEQKFIVEIIDKTSDVDK